LSFQGWPGELFSWVSLPNLHGQDLFPSENVSYIVSGTDTLQIKESYSREAIESIISTTRVEDTREDQTDWNEYNQDTLTISNEHTSLTRDDNDEQHGQMSLIEQVEIQNGTDCVQKWLPIRFT